jgi:hypothetical protein
MVTLPSILCPRCGRHNLSRARFCAQCGLNLTASGASEIGPMVPGRRRKSRAGAALFVILLGLFLAAMGSLFRNRACSRRPPMPRSIFQPAPVVPQPGEPWMQSNESEAEEPASDQWHSKWETER